MKEHKEYVRRCGIDIFFKTEKELNGIPEKSSESSTKFRQDANKLYSNKNHSVEIHRQILSMYTKSIAFAPNDSEEMALGYSNRSALLKHLHKYKESILDIERALALKLGVTQELREKLELRKKDCLTAIENPPDKSMSTECFLLSLLSTKRFDNSKTELDEIKRELPKLDPSTEIACYANSTSLKYDEKFGRQIVATRNLKPGEIVALEKGFVNFPLKSNIYLLCSHCLDIAWNAIPCSECACVVYCSEECKTAAWGLYHDTECNILPFLSCVAYAGVELAATVVTARLFIKAVKKEGLENVMSEAKKIDKNKDKFIKNVHFDDSKCHEKFRLIYSLLDSSRFSTSDNDDNEFFCSMVCHLLIKYTDILRDSASGKETVKKVLMKLKSILDENGYYFESPGFCLCKSMEECFGKCSKFLGLTFPPGCCFLNHSCVPNTARICTTGGKVMLFTISPVKKGEQLLISYGPSIETSKEKRDEHIRNIFHFVCQCKACIENWRGRSPFTSFQDILLLKLEESGSDIKKFCSQENISLNSFTYSGIDRITEQSLEDNIKVVNFIYENYRNTYQADALSFKCKTHIYDAFGKFYGVKCKIPYNC